MKAIRALHIVLKDEVFESQKQYLREAIEEVEELQRENTALKILTDRLKIGVAKGVDTSCDGCMYKDENELMDYSCLECSRYYTDKFKKEGEKDEN